MGESAPKLAPRCVRRLTRAGGAAGDGAPAPGPGPAPRLEAQERVAAPGIK
jgi:hypothetical protein